MATANGASDAARYVANIFLSFRRDQHCRLGVLQKESGSTMRKVWAEGVWDCKFDKHLAYCNANRVLHTSVEGKRAAWLRQL